MKVSVSEPLQRQCYLLVSSWTERVPRSGQPQEALKMREGCDSCDRSTEAGATGIQAIVACALGQLGMPKNDW